MLFGRETNVDNQEDTMSEVTKRAIRVLLAVVCIACFAQCSFGQDIPSDYR